MSVSLRFSISTIETSVRKAKTFPSQIKVNTKGAFRRIALETRLFPACGMFQFRKPRLS